MSSLTSSATATDPSHRPPSNKRISPYPSHLTALRGSGTTGSGSGTPCRRSTPPLSKKQRLDAETSSSFSRSQSQFTSMTSSSSSSTPRGTTRAAILSHHSSSETRRDLLEFAHMWKQHEQQHHETTTNDNANDAAAVLAQDMLLHERRLVALMTRQLQINWSLWHTPPTPRRLDNHNHTNHTNPHWNAQAEINWALTIWCYSQYTPPVLTMAQQWIQAMLQQPSQQQQQQSQQQLTRAQCTVLTLNALTHVIQTHASHHPNLFIPLIRWMHQYFHLWNCSIEGVPPSHEDDDDDSATDTNKHNHHKILEEWSQSRNRFGHALLDCLDQHSLVASTTTTTTSTTPTTVPALILDLFRMMHATPSTTTSSTKRTSAAAAAAAAATSPSQTAASSTPIHLSEQQSNTSSSSSSSEPNASTTQTHHPITTSTTTFWNETVWLRLIPSLCTALSRHVNEERVQLPGLALLAGLSEQVVYRRHIAAFRQSSPSSTEPTSSKGTTTATATPPRTIIDAIVAVMQSHETKVLVQCNATASLCWLLHNPPSSTNSNTGSSDTGGTNTTGSTVPHRRTATFTTTQASMGSAADAAADTDWTQSSLVPRSRKKWHDILVVVKKTLSLHGTDTAVFGNCVCLLTALPVHMHLSAVTDASNSDEAIEGAEWDQIHEDLQDSIARGMTYHVASPKVQACCLGWMMRFISTTLPAARRLLSWCIPPVLASMKHHIDNIALQGQGLHILSASADMNSQHVLQYNCVDAVLTTLSRHGKTDDRVKQTAAWFMTAVATSDTAAASLAAEEERRHNTLAFRGGLGVVELIWKGWGLSTSPATTRDVYGGVRGNGADLDDDDFTDYGDDDDNFDDDDMHEYVDSDDDFDE